MLCLIRSALCILSISAGSIEEKLSEVSLANKRAISVNESDMSLI